jgi:hypothetical protein
MDSVFAVLREGHGLKSFSTYHDTKKEAILEAQRLCRKEGCLFLVFQSVASVEPANIPVNVTELSEKEIPF